MYGYLFRPVSSATVYSAAELITVEPLIATSSPQRLVFQNIKRLQVKSL